MATEFKEILIRVGTVTDEADLRKTKCFQGIEIAFVRTHVSARSRDDRGEDYTLYLRPGGKGYFVVEKHWSRWQGESDETAIYAIKDDAELINKYPALANKANIHVVESLD